jgi:hypothetical protein
MRTIKFRGLTKNGKWIYGMPTHDFEYIFNKDNLDSPNNYEIIPETVGQFTGELINDSIEVYEGDRIKCLNRIKNDIFTVHFAQCEFYVYNGFSRENLHTFMLNNDIEIIGNIHEL